MTISNPPYPDVPKVPNETSFIKTGYIVVCHYASRIQDIAKKSFLILSMVYMTKNDPYIMTIGAVLGVCYPDFFKKTTNKLFNVITVKDLFNEKTPDHLKSQSDRIIWKINKCFNYSIALFSSLSLAFLSLPVVTVQLTTLFVGAKFGASDLRLDKFFE